jgi:malate dehydrogenase (decarboxylating)
VPALFAVNSYRSLEKNTRGEPDSIVALAKWRILNRLHDRNETLYFRVSPQCCSIVPGRKTDAIVIAVNLECLYGDMLCFCQVLIDNIKDFAPIIYTPTVGLVCENYSGLFRRPRGMYFTAKDKGEMMSMIYNWPQEKVITETAV